MPLSLFFLRHGQTACSRDNVFCGGGLDPDLTSDGLEMAKAFASAYKSTQWSAIFAGPLRRTIETARPISGAGGIPLDIREELREISYGEWDGKTVEAVDRDYHDDYTAWLADPAWNAPTGGEGVASPPVSIIVTPSPGDSPTSPPPPPRSTNTTGSNLSAH